MSRAPDLVEERGMDPAAPQSVVRAQILLRVQAFLWGVAGVGALAVLAADARAIIAGHITVHAAWVLAGGVLVLALLTGMAAVSAFLAAGLRRRSEKARVAAAVLESIMTCLGLLIAGAADLSGGVPADLLLVAGLVGAGLSFSAAVGLMRGSARHFAAR